MSPEEQARKLTLIARLSASELDGWVWWIEMDGREPFPGELAALAKREKELGVRK